MKSISYEYKHPTGGDSAYVTHDTYNNGDQEFLAHVKGYRATRHSSFDKAEQRVRMHGYTNHEEPVNESIIGHSFSALMENFNFISESAAPGMEDWVIANKQKFINQYGKEKGLEILYATSWKIHDKKSAK